MKSIFPPRACAVQLFTDELELAVWLQSVEKLFLFSPRAPHPVLICTAPLAKEQPGQVCAVIAYCATVEEAADVHRVLAIHARSARKSYIRTSQARSRLKAL